jgi:hypothetical protein
MKEQASTRLSSRGKDWTQHLYSRELQEVFNDQPNNTCRSKNTPGDYRLLCGYVRFLLPHESDVQRIHAPGFHLKALPDSFNPWI